MKLQDRVSLITGGSKGIGRAISLAFAREGANIVLADIAESSLIEVAAEIKATGRNCLAVTVDISRADQVSELVNKALREFGKVDILMNNAGIAGPTVDVSEIEIKDWEQVLAINLTGSMLCAKNVLKKSMIPRQSGVIINMSSELGRKGIRARSPYIASKWGVIGLTQGLAWEVGKYGIRVNCIAPGPARGDRMNSVFKALYENTGVTVEEQEKNTKARSPLDRMTEPDELADLAVFLASDESRGITGQTINCNVGVIMN